MCVQILQSVTLQIGPLQCTLNSATREQNRRQRILAVVFLLWQQAEKDMLLTYEIHIDEKDKPHMMTYINEIQQLFHRVSTSFCLFVSLTLLIH